MKFISQSISVMALSCAVMACAESLPVQNQPCPCGEGYVCCETGLCAPSAAACPGTEQALIAEAAGVWTGYLEHFQTLPSDQIRLDLKRSGKGSTTGTVTFGQAPAPARPITPDTVFPPGHRYENAGDPPVLIEGATYTVKSATWSDRRLKFSISSAEPFDAWCALQPSYANDPIAPSESCLPNAGRSWGSGGCLYEDPATRAPVAIPCVQWALCFGVNPTCTCDASGCRASAREDIHFDLSLARNRGTGSTSGKIEHDVRLTRTPSMAGE